MRDQPARLFRAAVVSAVVFTLSTGAHVIGGGTLPHAHIVLALTTVTMLACTAGIRHALRLPVAITVLCAGQFMLHHAFELLRTAAACVPVSPHLRHWPDHAFTSCTTGPLAIQQPAEGSGASVVMSTAHLAATVTTAVVITRGEEALNATAAWLRPLFAALRLAGFPPLSWATRFVQGRRLIATPFVVSPPLRGPPAFP